MLIQQNIPIATYPQHSDTRHISNIDLRTDQFPSTRIFVTQRPTQSDMNQYMKNVYMQTMETNSHVDRVRMNYIKLRNRRSSLNTHVKSNDVSTEQLKTQTSLSLKEITKYSSMAQYLRQLQEDSKKTTLPTEIINNKTLCSLYYKLDLFENNLISEHQKQHQINHINNNTPSYSHSVTQSNHTKDQLQWKNRLSQVKNTLLTVYQHFQSLKQPLHNNNAHQLQFQQCNLTRREYINSLSHEAEYNIKLIQTKVENIEQKLKKVEQQQVEKLQLQSKRQQIVKSLRQLMCQLYRRQSMF